MHSAPRGCDYGYLYSKQNAIQFVNSWVDYGYTRTPALLMENKLNGLKAVYHFNRRLTGITIRTLILDLAGLSSSGYRNFLCSDKRVALFVGVRRGRLRSLRELITIPQRIGFQWWW